MSNGKLAFLPWLRQGAAAAIATLDDGSAALAANAEFDVDVEINGMAGPSVKLRLHGPGHIMGLDRAQIVRTVPEDLVTDFDPNLFAAVEFDRPDLPWLFSPAKASGDDRLRPWLVLVVVERSEDVSLGHQPGSPLPVLQIKANASAQLPPLGESWAWAHTQIAGTLAGADLDGITRDFPQRTLSRLLCPRALRSNTAYEAYLVPAFAAGVQAGLGHLVTVTDLTPAWEGDENAISLPVYHRWRFSTGSDADFESLVKLLKPHPIPDEVGKRPLDVSRPGYGMPEELSPVILGLEGALRAPRSMSTPWPAVSRARFEAALANILDAPEHYNETTAEEELVAPPMYGRWQAAARSIPPVGASPLWFRDLNLDPRNRVAASAGTIVVQLHQEELMAAAWAQVGEILRANQLLRFAQLARAGASSIRGRHLAPLSDGSLLLVAGPAFSRLRVAGSTSARGALAGHCLTPAMVSGTFRKVMRPRGPISRRFGRFADRPLVHGHAVRDVAAGKHRLPLPGLPDGGQAINEDMLDLLLRPKMRVPKAERSALDAHFQHLKTLAAIPDADPCRELDSGALAAVIMAGLDPEKTIPARARAQLDMPDSLWKPNDPLEPIMFAPDFPTPMYIGLKELSQEWLMPGLKKLPPNTVSIAETNPAFVEAYLVGLNHELSRELLWRQFPTDQRGSYFRQFWDARARVPQRVDAAGREATKDIDPIHTWDRCTSLGTHVRGGAGANETVLVVRGDLLRRYPRATVCLQRAAWSTNNAGAPIPPRVLADSIRYPIFGAALDPDVTLLGFDLPASVLRGRFDPASGDPGWFVVFQEQPTEPRFGFGARGTAVGGASAWSGIDWSQIALTSSNHVNISATASGPNKATFDAIGRTTGVSWGTHSATMAAIALKHPFRLAVHAVDMLP